MATKKRATKKATKKTTAKKAVKRSPAKKAVKRAPAKKATKRAAPKKAARKTTARKAAPKKAAPKAIGLVKGKAMTKAQVLSTIAEHAELTKKQVGHVLELLEHVMVSHLRKGSVGAFKFNGLNVKAVNKPARKARKGINPFTGEAIMIKAKPAYRSVRVSALKGLKEKVS